MSSDNSLSREHLMQEVDSSWKELQTLIESLTEEQLTQPTDAAGWTVKDHVIHIAAWVEASIGMLEGKSKREILDISPEIWAQDDDPVNAVLQQRYQNVSVEEAKQTLKQNHGLMLEKLNAMSQEDMFLPYSHYQTQSSEDLPIIKFLNWDTVEHYREHIPWMQAIVGIE